MAKKNNFDSVRDAMRSSTEIDSEESILRRSAPSSAQDRKFIKKTLPLSILVPNPKNRYSMEKDDEYQELVRGIAKDGLLSPIIVKQADSEGNYTILSGHKRRLACLEAGLEKVPVEVIPFELTEADEAAFIARANSGNRQSYPYDNALQLKEYFDALLSSGTDEKELRKIGHEAFNQSERTYRNYYVLATGLPYDILEIGQQRIITRDHGLELAKALNDDETKRIAENVLSKLRELAEKDGSFEEKEAAAKRIMNSLSKNLDRKSNTESTKKANSPADVYKVVKRIDKMFSFESYKLPKKPERKKETLDLIENTMRKLQEMKEKLES